LHNTFEFVSDLHTDTLMWTYRGNFAHRTNLGHLDLPRMVQANQAFQIFATVTRVPIVQRFENNDNTTDIIRFLAVLQRWPYQTWSSSFEKAIFMAQVMHQVQEQSNGTFTLIKNKQLLEDFVTRRKTNKQLTSGLVCIEGAHAFEGKLENIDKMYDAGIRCVGLSHFSVSDFGGCRHGSARYGLVEPFGKQALEKIIAKRMLIDITHASEQLTDDVIELTEGSKYPLFISHTGVKGTCNNTRNLSDKHMKAIAARGGVIGIAFFDKAICGRTMKHIVDAVRYAVDLVGEDYVAMGSDFDGAVKTVIDASELNVVTFALLQAGFTKVQVQKIMSDNVLRFLRMAL